MICPQRAKSPARNYFRALLRRRVRSLRSDWVFRPAPRCSTFAGSASPTAFPLPSSKTGFPKHSRTSPSPTFRRRGCTTCSGHGGYRFEWRSKKLVPEPVRQRTHNFWTSIAVRHSSRWNGRRSTIPGAGSSTAPTSTGPTSIRSKSPSSKSKAARFPPPLHKSSDRPSRFG